MVSTKEEQTRWKEQGREEGREQGREQGLKEGREEYRSFVIKKLLGKLEDCEIARIVGCSLETVSNIRKSETV